MPQRKSVLKNVKISLEDECGLNTTLAETEKPITLKKTSAIRKSITPAKVGLKRKAKQVDKENERETIMPLRTSLRASKRMRTVM